MKIANVRDFRNKLLVYLKEDESVIVTRHGKVTGILYPIKETSTLPEGAPKDVKTLLGHAERPDPKVLALSYLKKTFRIKTGGAYDAKKLQKAWKFSGSLSSEVIAERDKR
jgi:hypothetical protein